MDSGAFSVVSTSGSVSDYAKSCDYVDPDGGIPVILRAQLRHGT